MAEQRKGKLEKTHHDEIVLGATVSQLRLLYLAVVAQSPGQCLFLSLSLFYFLIFFSFFFLFLSLLDQRDRVSIKTRWSKPTKSSVQTFAILRSRLVGFFNFVYKLRLEVTFQSILTIQSRYQNEVVKTHEIIPSEFCYSKVTFGWIFQVRL